MSYKSLSLATLVFILYLSPFNTIVSSITMRGLLHW